VKGDDRRERAPATIAELRIRRKRMLLTTLNNSFFIFERIFFVDFERIRVTILLDFNGIVRRVDRFFGT